MVGYEQSYLSALELGLKGPPTEEFVGQLVRVLGLNDGEEQLLQEAVAASQRKLNVPNEAPEEVFWLCHKLRQQIDRLHPVQIELIETALSLPVSLNLPATGNIPQRIRRRSPKNQKMEAKM